MEKRALYESPFVDLHPSGVDGLFAQSEVDAYTRECLALEADTSLGSGRVTRVLDRLIEERGRPENVRSDNGPEFTSRRILGWAEERKVELIHIQPGRPMQNGHVESFHGRLRDECLNAAWFRTLGDVRQKLADWQQEYNSERPHSSLDYRTPEEFRKTLEGRGAMAPLPSENNPPPTTKRNSSYDWLRKGGRSPTTDDGAEGISATDAPALCFQHVHAQ